MRTGALAGQTAGVTSLPADLALLVGTSHHLVLIRIADSTVSELNIPGLDARQTGAQLERGHSVSSGNGTEGVKRSLSQRHRKASPSFAASLRDLNTRMARLIDGGGDRALPAGLRGIDSDFVKSRVVSDDGHEDSSAPKGHAGGGTSAHPKWIECCEVAVPGRVADTVQVLLLSHARASYLVALRTDEAAAGDAIPILLHTFTWPTTVAAPLVRVVAAVAPADDALHPRGPSASLHLSLVGFTQTGILVSEHLVSSAAILSRVSAGGPERDPAAAAVVVRSAPVARRSPAAALSAASLAAPSPSPTHADPDLSDRAAFDFGRAIGRICPIADGWTVVEPAVCGLDDGDPSLPQSQLLQQSEYFWVQGRAEWMLKRLVCEDLSPTL